MKVITVCTDTKMGYYQALKNSVTCELITLGLGMKWTGLSMKTRLLIDYFSSSKLEDEVVAVVDGCDVIFVQPCDIIEQKFKELNTDILLSGCLQHLYDNGVRRDLHKHLFNQIDKYETNANSGTLMGYAHALKYLYSLFEQEDISNDDEFLLNKIINTHPEINYKIDLKREIFFVYCKVNCWDSFCTKPPKITGLSQTCIVHGINNTDMTDICKQLDLPLPSDYKGIYFVNFYKEQTKRHFLSACKYYCKCYLLNRYSFIIFIVLLFIIITIIIIV